MPLRRTWGSRFRSPVAAPTFGTRPSEISDRTPITRRSIAPSRGSRGNRRPSIRGNTMKGTLRRLLTVALLVIGSSFAHAQDYPSRVITMIIPFPPGGSTDVLGRVLAETMTKSLGQQVIVQNAGGAGGTIGVGQAARAAPD